MMEEKYNDFVVYKSREKNVFIHLNINNDIYKEEKEMIKYNKKLVKKVNSKIKKSIFFNDRRNQSML